MGKLKILINLVKRTIYSPTRYAKSIGVNIGSNNILFSVGWSSEPYLITVGSNCQITKGVKIFTHGGSFVLRKEFPDFDCFGKVEIKNNVYIGNNSMILPGVTIGNNVLVAAGSVVTKSVPDNVCIGGNPARILCSIEEFKNNNLKYNVGTKGLSYKDKKEV
ncbi:MAG: acyltransferase [Flavobacterium sp.]|nr:MAG: acyltransferase [Flavobacterium sp.]